MGNVPPVSLVGDLDRWVFPAGAASLQQYQFVTFNASGQIITPTSGVFCVVLDDAPSLASSTLNADGLYSGGYTVGENYTCVFQGVQKVITGANLTAGQAIMSDNSGHAIAATGSGNIILGWALYSSNSGDVAPILLDRCLHN